jgi:pimeloyl-ACP methyl ester carboxylesterase
VRTPFLAAPSLACGLVIALVASGCHRTQPGEGSASLTLSACRPHGAKEEVRCGTFEVWENRATKSGRRIKLAVDVVPALSTSPLPDPVFVLAGGPGQGAADVLGGVLPMLEKLHRRHDLVFVDQRGTGASSPLKCTNAEDAGLAEKLRDGVDTAALRTCLADLRRAGLDPAMYTTSPAMDDLDDVRAALGYGAIDLWGVSYGTRAALTYLRQHGEHARAVVLDGVDPPSMSLIVASAENAERAFGKVFAACDADVACARTFPGLRGELTTLLASLEAHPVTTTIADPTTGARTLVTITRNSFILDLHGLLYQPDIAVLLPLVIDSASHGDFAPFAAQATATSAIGDQISEGMYFSVVCAEDAPLATPDAVAAHTRGTLLGDAFAKSLLEVCSFWPRGPVPADFHDPVASSVPVLLLSGDLDPVTPPSTPTASAAPPPHATAASPDRVRRRRGRSCRRRRRWWCRRPGTTPRRPGACPSSSRGSSTTPASPGSI